MSRGHRKQLLRVIAKLYGGTTGDDIEQFADELNVTASAVRKWIYCERRPYYEKMQEIERLTGGHMRISDWQ